MKRYLFAAALALTIASPSMASVNSLSAPIDTDLDTRIKVFAYNPGIVYELPVTVGMATRIELAADEGITETPKLGETIQWRVAGGPRNLYIKALKPGAHTSLSVVTNRRSYEFELIANTDESTRIQKAYFVYPDDELKVKLRAEEDKSQRDAEASRLQAQNLGAAVDPAALNFAYRIDGDATFKPTAVYDNGQFTYMRLPKTQDLPAVFLVGEDKMLTPINYVVRKDEIIIERTAPQFVLKLGKDEVRISAQGDKAAR